MLRSVPRAPGHHSTLWNDQSVDQPPSNLPTSRYRDLTITPWPRLGCERGGPWGRRAFPGVLEVASRSVVVRPPWQQRGPNGEPAVYLLQGIPKGGARSDRIAEPGFLQPLTSFRQRPVWSS